MKNLLLVSLFLIHILCYSQQPVDLPDFTPPSPEANAITQYGDQIINESTGKFSTSIPLYTYRDGKLQVPISLSYVGNGVKVNDPNTWMGVNWTLNAGGVITRTVYHNPDEVVGLRVFRDEIEGLNLVNPFDNADSLYSFFYSSNNNWDSQPDIFNFSFGGYSGSFYLDEEEMKPTLITASSELKIEIVGNESNSNHSNFLANKQFKITTPDGIEYFFGGNHAIEQTSMVQDGHTEVTPKAITSFYLTEIKHPINGHVFLDYTSVGDYRISTQQNRVLKFYGKHPLITNEDIVIGQCVNLSSAGTVYKKIEETPINSAGTIVYNKIYDGKYLSKIYSLNNSTFVNFNVDNNNFNTGSNFKHVLESIEVKNTNYLLNKIDFTYIFDEDNGIDQRFFLKFIEINKDFDQSGTLDPEVIKYQKYEFDYNDPLGLPKRFSSSQDALGYFNGKNNPDGLFPAFDLESMSDDHRTDLEGLFSGYPFFADRSTDTVFKSKGALKKIHYPTGGYSLIEYESPKSKKVSYESVLLETFRNNYPYNGSSGAYHNNVLTDSYLLGVPELGPNGEETSSHELNASRRITLEVTVESTQQTFHQDYATLKITNLTTNVEEMNEPILINGLDHFERRTFQQMFMKDDDYLIELSLTDVPGAPMTARLNFKYNNGYDIIDGEGLRVKRISDFTNNISSNLQSNIKRYYYTGVENVLKDPIDYVGNNYVEPEFYKEAGLLVNEYYIQFVLASQCLLAQVGAGDTRTSPGRGYVISINPTNDFYKYDILRNYKDVTISFGGDNFENGGVEKTFEKETGQVADGEGGRYITADIEDKLRGHYNAPWLRLKNGQLLKERKLIKKQDTIYKLNELKNKYLNRTIGAPQEVFLGSIYREWDKGYVFRNAWLGNYYIVSIDPSIKQTVNTSYIDPVPLAIGGSQQTNPYIFHGWGLQDHDNDGIFNFEDDDYITLINSYDGDVDESNYRKIVTTTDYEYDSEFAGQPTTIRTNSSVEGESMELRNYYLDAIGDLSGLTPDDISYYQDLEDGHRISRPVQTENYIDKDGVFTKLSTQRTLYRAFGGKVLDTIIQTSKGDNDLEDKIVFVDYDVNGNPTKVKYKDGSTTKYVYNGLNQVIKKIDNYTSEDFNVDLSGTDCEDNNLIYDGAQVTLYYYDNITNQIIQITDPRCNTVYYEYDEFHRLKHVKDKDGNILSKNEYNYQIRN